jgi:hypothetical protein
MRKDRHRTGKVPREREVGTFSQSLYIKVLILLYIWEAFQDGHFSLPGHLWQWVGTFGVPGAFWLPATSWTGGLA